MKEEMDDEAAGLDDLGDEDGWPDSISYDFAKARAETLQRTLQSDFAELQRELKTLQQTFVERAGDNEAYARHFCRQITEDLLDAAIHFQKQPFEICHGLWKELLDFGFVEIERKCHATWSFANCCCNYREIDLGLRVLEPLVIELEGLLADPSGSKPAAEYYREQLDHLGEVRTKLNALRV